MNFENAKVLDLSVFPFNQPCSFSHTSPGHPKFRRYQRRKKLKAAADPLKISPSSTMWPNLETSSETK